MTTMGARDEARQKTQQQSKMKLIDGLKPEERLRLAAAALKARPNAQYRARLRKLLARKRRKLKLRCGTPRGDAT
jgi:hypothetical protein